MAGNDRSRQQQPPPQFTSPFDSSPPSIPLQPISPHDPQRSGSRSRSRSGERLQAGQWFHGETLHHLEPPPVRRDPTTGQMAANLPGISTYWEQPYGLSPGAGPGAGAAPPPAGRDPAPPYTPVPDSRSESPIDPTAFSFALPPELGRGPVAAADDDPFSDHLAGAGAGAGPRTPPYYDDPHQAEYSDHTPLTTQPQPIAGALATGDGESQPRDSFVTVRDLDNSPARSRDTRRMSEANFGNPRHQFYGQSLAPSAAATASNRRSRSPSTVGALSRAGSIMRAMSQRVVMISGDDNIVDHNRNSEQDSRSRSPSSVSADGRHSRLPSVSFNQDTPYPAQSQARDVPPEKRGDEPAGRFLTPSFQSLPPAQPSPVPAPQMLEPMPNPLRGKSLGVFSPENPIRRRLCDLLIHPLTEPVILILIIAQAILLAVEAGPNVFANGGPHSDRWGSTWFDWAILGLFIVFTLEIIARIIVSGLVLNAAEYSTIDRSRGIRAAVSDQYRAIFQPQRAKSVRAAAAAHRQTQLGAGPAGSGTTPTLGRSFTTLIHHGQAVPRTIEEQQRWQLARRAFLRHGFNRLDFIAVVSFWAAFSVSITGLEGGFHLHVFRMLSCLRILRLLALTNGTAIILRSLKKAAPLLVRVAFLLGFFWLLFAIIGVQSFKSSLSRQCVWLDPQDPTNRSASYTNEFAFCGGYLDKDTGATWPWATAPDPNSLANLTNTGGTGKGHLCPRGSVCLQGQNPYNGTVNFDDIFHSMELVFVIMSANTWSDLMYYTIDSDYPPAGLFFGAGIMVMMLWLTNLLIAVITSSFQVIREESKSSAFTVDQEPLLMHDEDDDLGAGLGSGGGSGDSLGGGGGGGGSGSGGPDTSRIAPRRKSQLQRLYDKTFWFWILLITFALLAQCFRTSSMSARTGRAIDGIELAVTVMLDLEIAARLAADWRRFHRGWRNLVDLGLAVITTIILIPPIRNSGDPYNWLTMFQSLRAYRIVLAVPVTRKLILLVLGNATGIANLMLFVFLVTFFMAIFAVQLFRGEIPQFDSSGELIRISFFNIFNSFLGMYQILSSENWTDVLYSAQSYTTGHGTTFVGIVFCIGWFILAFFILVNMFIAVIQENFDVSEDEKRLEQVKAFLQRKELGRSSGNMALSTIFKFGRGRRRRDPLDYGPAMMEMLLKDAVVREFLDEQHVDDAPLQERPLPPLDGGANSRADGGGGSLPALLGRIRTMLGGGADPNPFYSSFRLNTGRGNDDQPLDPRQMARDAVSATNARRRAQRDYLARHPTYNTALFIFRPHNPIRRLCQRIVGPGRGSERFDGVAPNRAAWYIFSAFIYATIVVMVVLACYVTPLYQLRHQANKSQGEISWYMVTDLLFAAIFTTEAIIKVVADGLLWTPNAYYRSSWGIIDGFVLITLWANALALFALGGSVTRSIGAFKALRALRLLNVSESARDTFHDLVIVGWWKLCGATLVSISLLVPFAIYGLNLFSGRMVSCNDDNAGGGGGTTLTSCFGEYNSSPFNWSVLAPRVASNSYFHFDNFPAALFILFQIVSQEGWVDVSFRAQSITGVGLQPLPLASQGNALFFVAFNLLGTVFVTTLFISVFMRNYTEQTGVAFLTAEQRSWLELRKLLRQISPSKSSYDDSERSWKKWCHKRAIEKRGLWYLANTWLLVFHLLLLVLEYESEPDFWSRARPFLFLFCILVFCFNVAVRIVGLGWTRFRRSSWDLYSLLVVTGAFVSTVALLLINDPKPEAYARLNKFFLVGIVLLLIPRNDALDQLLKTAAACLTTIGNLLATWLVFFLFFAILMVQAFGLTRFGTTSGNTMNLRTVPNALLMLFKMSVGEGWNQIMEDYASIEPPLCVEATSFLDSDCGSKAWARALFLAWNLVSMYIFVNLFVSLIYESFSYVYQRSSGLAVVDRDEIRRFKEAWRTVDPAGTGFISKETFPRLLGELSGVFQMRIYDQDDSVRQILEDSRNDGDRDGDNKIAAGAPLSAATGRRRSGPAGPGGVPAVGPAALEHGLDLRKLADRLSHIDVARVRERRRRFNVFFEEVMVSADPDRGISFTSVLMILAHYNIISDSKSLKLEEFLRRRARLQRVEEEVRRRVVLGFFDTLYYSRQFKRYLEKKRSGRMTQIPQLDIPDILVDDEGDQPVSPSWSPSFRRRPVPSSSSSQQDGQAGTAADGSRSRAASATGTDAAAAAAAATAAASSLHPLSVPRASSMASSVSSISRNDGSTSAFSFEIHDGTGAASSPGRRRDSVSPAQMRGILDDSVWAESIRRSATVRGSQRYSRRYGDV